MSQRFSGLSRATYGKMVQNLFWAVGYNVFAIPLAAGVAYAWGLLLTPAMGAVLMAVSTVIVAVNARLLGRRDVEASAARKRAAAKIDASHRHAVGTH